jgi:urease accessory protein
VIQVDRVAGRSRLVRSVSQDPLKLLSTRSGDSDCCSVVVSNYGGGFLQGDRAHLTVNCSDNARLYLGTQALNKVYRCPGQGAEQTIVGTVEEGARVASLPDPVMLFADSRFVQRQSWTVGPGAVLAIADGMLSGRSALGESFAFDEYRSETRVFREGRPIATENTRCEPKRLRPAGIAAFGEGHLTFSLLVVGTADEACFEQTVEVLEQSAGEVHADGVAAVFTRPKKDVAVVRMIAVDLVTADEPMRRLNGCVAQSMLDFNPIARKA